VVPTVNVDPHPDSITPISSMLRVCSYPGCNFAMSKNVDIICGVDGVYFDLIVN
jgi:hypothetical protein